VLRVPDDEIEYDNDLTYSYRGKPFTGVSYDDVPGHGLSEVSYVDGLQDGPARDWYVSGQPKSETLFRRNVRHGLSRVFREDGTLASEEIWDLGIHIRSSIFGEDGTERIAFELSEENPNYRILQRHRGQVGE
jgi:antitoxin component YwqK of YwqJK toxin-antitoxin module